MVKKNVLTPVLAGVLGVTVAGSGVLYVLDNKDSGKTSDKDNITTDTAVKAKAGETAFARVQDKVQATAEKVEKAFNGELDFAYNGKAEISFGPAVTKDFGVQVKPITIEAKTRQKSGMSEADITAAYDSKTLATLNFIADSANKKVYIKIPELSSAYLTATEDDITKLLDQSGNLRYSLTGTKYGSGNITTMFSNPLGNPNMDKLKEMIDQIDMDALLKDLEEYVDIIKEKIPEGTDKGTVSGDINGNSYNYTVKSVNITGKVISDVTSAVSEKLKNDQTMKDSFTKMGVNVDQYTQMIDSLSKSMTKSKDLNENADKTLFTVDVFYLGDDPTGVEVDFGGTSKFKMISLNSKDVLGIDLSLSSNGKEQMSVKGAFKNENNTINGDFKIVSQKGNTASEFAISVNDLKEQGDLFSGSIKAEVKGGPGISVDSASTADKLDITLKLSENSEEAVTVKLTGEKTDATDVSLPTGDAFNLDEAGLKKYIDTFDKAKFEKTVKDALGDELWNKLQSRKTVSSSGADDWD